jgi:alkanesulfonate monooxygenase SsuD/methylene tetrahydromethanopterin reductase-like flavin-dependent oxidoreductase (luciferase family)
VRRRTIEVSRAPDRAGGSHILAYDHDDADNQAALYGTPDEIVPKLEELRAAGVNYVLGNFGGTSRSSLQRFAREIVPSFA